MCRKNVLTIVAVAILALAIGQVQAVTVTVPIDNPGFEDPVLGEDDWTWLDVPGWTWVGGEGPGIWHVTNADFDPVVAPEGQNVLYTENAVGDAGGVAQVLTDTFAANMDYTLTVEVGNSYYYYNAGYSVQLLAGGVVIAEDNDTLWPDYYKWATSTVEYTYDPADAALVGQPLEIRLLNLALDKDSPPAGEVVGVEFDNVTLSYVPEPAAPTMVPITVPDAGFDDHVLNNVGDYIYVGDEAYTGAWKSAGGDAWIDYGYWAGDIDLPALSGNNKLYLYESDPDYVYQILDETFIEGGTYTLSVWVGIAWSGYEDQWSLYFTGEDHANNLSEASGSAPVGSWQQVSLVYTATNADAGKKIGIKMTGAIYVTFEDVTLSYDASAEPGVTITVEEGGDIAVANELAKAGDTIEIAAGTYVLASQIMIKDGVTYRGAGPGLTIIDGNDVTRAFAAFGDRSLNDGNENPNDSGPKGWVLEGMTIQNCVADTNNRFSYAGAAFDLLDVFADNDTDGSGGLNPEEADADVGAIRLGGADGTEGTEDDDLHRFAAMDADGNGELSEAELNDQLLSTEVEFPDEDGDGGAITIHNESVGTIQNCDFLANHTPAEGDGDDGGAINITGRSTITINDCFFNGNYACSPDSVSIEGADGDAGHIKAQGNNLTNGFINVGTTLIINRCVFLNGNAEDDAGAIQANAQGIVVRIDSCWFEGNTSWDNGNVLQFPNEDQNEATVTNCVFTNNVTKADNSPDRMCEVRRNTKFINCTFVGNVQEDQDLIYNNANDADGDHDGVDDEMSDVTQVINCLFLNNVVGNGDDVLGSRNDNFSIAATNCLFFGNTLQNGDPADNTQRPDVETGSVLSDPLLDADLVPGAGSEAIDGGVDPATIGVTLTNDYNGDTRPKGAAYDIGAFEVK